MSKKEASEEDFSELVLRFIEVGGKVSSFIVPSMYKLHGDFFSEVLYACGNFASTIRQLYHSGMLMRTLKENTVSILRKFIETFEVVFECFAYKFGSKRIKWIVILALQAFKLLLSLYLTHVRQIVLDESRGGRRCVCDADGSPPPRRQCQNRPRLAELLHSARPLLHAGLYVWRGRESWLPWCASAAADVLSLSCLPSRGCLSRRQVECRAAWLKSAALAYAFRTPCHDRLVRPVAEWLAGCPMPVIRSFFKLLLSYIVYWRLYYANMWG